MTQSISQIEQASELTVELTGEYTLGALGAAAGIPGSVELQDQVVALMSSIGVDIGQIPTGSPAAEAGLAVVARTGVRAALNKFSKKAAKSILKSPAKWGAAVAIGSAGVGVYNWLSPDQTVALEQVRQQSQIISQQLATLPPEARQQVLETLAGTTFGIADRSHWPWIAGVVALSLGGLWYWRVYLPTTTSR